MQLGGDFVMSDPASSGEAAFVDVVVGNNAGLIVSYVTESNQGSFARIRLVDLI